MKIAFVFPGQGSQYVGMGKDLYENSAIARRIFEEANDVLGYDLKKMCFEGPEDELKITYNTQPAILVVSTACWSMLKERGISPAAVAGHSLGEYSALVAAGALSFAKALELVRKRGRFMWECAPSSAGMAAILGLTGDLVQKACDESSPVGVVEIANFNCPGQIVIAGEESALQKAMELCKDHGAKRVLPLQVSGPFHSSLMSEAANKLAVELRQVEISQPACPLISNVTADAAESPEEIRKLLEKQVDSSVRWEESIIKLSSMGIEGYVEVGPGKVLTGLGKKIIKDGKFFNVEDIESLEKILDNLREVL